MKEKWNSITGEEKNLENSLKKKKKKDKRMRLCPQKICGMLNGGKQKFIFGLHHSFITL